MLTNSQELSLHLNDPQWVIFDCRHDLLDKEKGERLYREGHIPGAHYANVETDLAGEKTGLNGRHPLPSPAGFAGFLARHGVMQNSMVVAYDDVGGQFASRLWWLARWIGLKNAVLLDGGIPQWIADRFPVSTAVPVPRPVALRAEPDPRMFWSAAEVQNHLDDPAFALVDARAAERYRGEIEPIDPVAGHIPGALNRFYKMNLNADLTLRPAEELRREFRELASDKQIENIVHHCGSGVTACMNIFAMEYAGLTGSKLYPGSWSEWIADPSRPTVRQGE